MKKLLKRMVPWVQIDSKIIKKHNKGHRHLENGRVHLAKLYEYKRNIIAAFHLALLLIIL